MTRIITFFIKIGRLVMQPVLLVGAISLFVGALFVGALGSHASLNPIFLYADDGHTVDTKEAGDHKGTVGDNGTDIEKDKSHIYFPPSPPSPPLTLSCEGMPERVKIAERVVWRAFAGGGTEPYEFLWEGDTLFGAVDTISTSYASAGTKRGSVTVTDAEGESKTAWCEIKVSDEIVIPLCSISPAAGRIIASFPTAKKIVANRGEADAKNGPIDILLPAGEYKVTLAAFDGYKGRENVSQPNEQWFAALSSGATTTVVYTGATGDLPDNVRTAGRSDLVNDQLHIPFDITKITAVHAAYPHAIRNSVFPICAAFDPIVITPPPPPVNPPPPNTPPSEPPPPPPSSNPPPSNPPPPPSGCSGNCGGGGGANQPNVFLIKGASSTGFSTTVYLSQIPFVGTTTGRVAGVFLSQLPYTGILSDYGSVILFFIGILFWSALVAYAIHKNWHRKIAFLFRALRSVSILEDQTWNSAESFGENKEIFPESALTRASSPPSVLMGNPYSSISAAHSKGKNGYEVSHGQLNGKVNQDAKDFYVNELPEGEILISGEEEEIGAYDVTEEKERPREGAPATSLRAGDISRGVFYAREGRKGEFLNPRGHANRASRSKEAQERERVIKHTLPTILIREAQKEKVIISDEGFDLIMSAGNREEETSLQILHQLISAANEIPRDGGWLSLKEKDVRHILFSTYMSMSSVFIDWLAKGDSRSVFAFIRTLTQQGHSIEAFLTEIVTLLDGQYRFRIEGDDTHYDPHVAENLREWSNERIQELVAHLITALDQGYGSVNVAAKMALIKVFSGMPPQEVAEISPQPHNDNSVRVPHEALI